MSMEIGGANGVRPLMAAAHLQRPVVDSDTMGRAYPEAQMTSVAVGGLTPYPLTAVDVRGFESIVAQGADLEVGRAGRAQDLRRIRLGRRHLPAAAHRRGGQAVGHPRHDHQGDRDRPGGARGPAPARRPRRRHPVGRAGQAPVQGQGDRRRTPRHRRLSARRCALRRHGRLARLGARRSTSRTNGSWPGATASRWPCRPT